MSFGVTLNTNKNYIDVSSVNEVAKQIFTKAETQTVDVNTVDLSKFRRPEVGIDFYSQRTNLETSRQIAIRNAGLDINLNENFVANVHYLNTVAAQSVNKISKNVEGRLIAPIPEGEKSDVKNVFELPVSVKVANSQDTNKDRRGSNPFAFYVVSANQGKENQEEPEMNIFM